LVRLSRQEADEDVGLNAVAALVPHWAHFELILLDAKSRLGLGELNVGLPEPFILPIVDVGMQKIRALGKRGPIVERCIDVDLEAETRRGTILNQAHLEALGGTLVLLQDAADLPVHLLAIETTLGRSSAGFASRGVPSKYLVTQRKPSKVTIRAISTCLQSAR